MCKAAGGGGEGSLSKDTGNLSKHGRRICNFKHAKMLNPLRPCSLPLVPRFRHRPCEAGQGHTKSQGQRHSDMAHAVSTLARAQPPTSTCSTSLGAKIKVGPELGGFRQIVEKPRGGRDDILFWPRACVRLESSYRQRPLASMTNTARSAEFGQVGGSLAPFQR